jgi:transketolase
MSEESLRLARLARIRTVQMTSAARASHVGSGLSVIDILAVLYSDVSVFNPRDANLIDRDRVIVSKGHAAAAVYAMLGTVGYFDSAWLDTYCLDGSQLGGHVTSHGVPGVEFSTGSLGHGLPLGVGIAIALLRRKTSQNVFVICSDGEIDEGTTWESALLAAHHDLSNLTLIIDRNRLQSLASTENTLRLEPLDKKFEAFGWEALIVDGHDHEQLAFTLKAPQDRPRVVIANTTKGKGVSFMEDSVLWHYRSPSIEERELAIKELGGIPDA